MCIMIHKPKGCKLTKKELERCWDNNPDGGTCTHLTPSGKFHIKRTMDKDVWVKHVLHNMKRELWIHARYTTRGASDIPNTHPYWMDKQHICMMNGTVKRMPDEDERSDTRIFCEDMLRSMPEGWLNDPTLFELVSGYIHTEGAKFGTKMIFVNRQGRTWILNENLGHWHDGMWFSNDWYKKDRVAKTSTTTWGYTSAQTSYEKGKLWSYEENKYVWPNELPKTRSLYDANFKPPVKSKAKSTSVAKVVKKDKPKTQDLITEIDCLYCGVPLIGETVEQMEKLCCPACESEQDQAVKSMINLNDMSADEAKYLRLSNQPFTEMSDEDYQFMSAFEMSQLQGA